ncbi:MAG: hypothetical protein ACLTE2_06075 [Eubacteriales bacterium]
MRAYTKNVHRFMQPEYAKQLFQNQMSVSATQIEQYHLCPFQYFLSLWAESKRTQTCRNGSAGIWQFNPIIFYSRYF